MSPDRPVLVVDDDLDIREALTETLQDRGFAVRAAANGREALNLVRALVVPPAMILLDLMMPVMDGYEFLAARKAEPALESIPVAVITAGYGVDRNRLGDQVPVLRKPVDVEEIVRALKSLGSRGAPP
jgi:CheY-like chemotaxis protein